MAHDLAIPLRRTGVALTRLSLLVAMAACLTAFSAPAFAAENPFVVAIDAGHQGRADLRSEPIGPGSETRKPRVAGGTSGVVTHNAESLINLQVALKLRDLLEQRGVKVVMVRSSQKVNISNSQRARTANAADADLLVRLHCDAAGTKTRGILTLVPGKTRWTGPIVKPSARAGSAIHRAVLAATGARDRGISPRTDMTGFNWSKVPCVIVEMGVMTNRTDDRLLASPSYQRKLATGMADGIMAYLAVQ